MERTTHGAAAFDSVVAMAGFSMINAATGANCASLPAGQALVTSQAPGMGDVVILALWTVLLAGLALTIWSRQAAGPMMER